MPRSCIEGRLTVRDRFISDYGRRRNLPTGLHVSPYVDGVRRSVKMGTAHESAARPGLKVGICGEHGRDRDSIAFFREGVAGLR